MLKKASQIQVENCNKKTGFEKKYKKHCLVVTFDKFFYLIYVKKI